MNQDLPSISATALTNSCFNLANATRQAQGQGIGQLCGNQSAEIGDARQYANALAQKFKELRFVPPTFTPPSPENIMAAPTRRLVQVFIADPNENVPLDMSLLYSGNQKLTDATDQELFFEIDIKTILEAHNAKRVNLVDKKVKERVEHLEPAKIRDLKMVIVNIAAF